MLDNDNEDTQEEKSILDIALTRYEDAKNYWSPIFDAYREDYLFYMGKQWSGSEEKKRQDANMSSLVYNTLPSKVKYIVNNARANTPAVKIHPITDGANKDTAMVFDGLIKSVENRGNSKQSYIKALECASIGGIGAWGVDIDKDEFGEWQITNYRIQDPTTVLMDPSAEAQDFSDARYAFKITQITKEEFEERFGEEEGIPSSSAWSDHSEWANDEMVQIAEYWVKDDGKVIQYLITKDRILSCTSKEYVDEEGVEQLDAYLGDNIPLCFMVGEELCIEGRKEYKGIVRDVKDMQYLLNLTKSKMADYIYQASTEEWLAEVGHIAPAKKMWTGDGLNNYKVKIYADVNGTKPQRIDPIPPPVGYIEAGKEADADIRATIGIRDPLQDIPSSQSGKAIALQISQGNIGTFQFMDNLNELIKYNGKIILNLIQKYYTTEQVREIIGLDDQITTVPVNQPYVENGLERIHDLKVGRYGLTVSTGANYQSQREETLDRLIELSQKNPQVQQFGSDMIVKLMDFAGSEELANRLKRALPANILQGSNPTEGGSPEDQLQMAQAQMAQMGQQMEEMNQQLQMLQGQNQELSNQNMQKMQAMQAEFQFEQQKLQFTLQHEAQMAQMKRDHELQMKSMDIEAARSIEDGKQRNQFAIESGKASIQLEMLNQESAIDKQMKLLDAQIALALQDEKANDVRDLEELKAALEVVKNAKEADDAIELEKVKGLIAMAEAAVTGQDLQH